MDALITDTGDLCVRDGDLVLEPSLKSQAEFAIRVHARDNSRANPRGFWGAPVGSRLWTRVNQPTTDETLRIIEQDIIEALQSFIDTGKVSAVRVTATSNGVATVGVDVVMMRGDDEVLTLRYYDLWEELQQQ